MGNSIPNAAAFLAAAHHRSLRRKKRGTSAVKTPGAVSKAVRIAVAAVVLAGLIGVIAMVLGLLT